MASFEETGERFPRSQEQREAIFQLVDHIGGLAVPTLLRQLFAGSASAGWACELLIHLADSEARCRRIARSLQSELQTHQLPEECRPAVAELLRFIGQPVPWTREACLVPKTQHSLCDLAAGIESAADLARAADTLLADLPISEVMEFLEDFANHEPAIAIALVGELLVRDAFTERTRAALRQLSVSISSENRSLTVSENTLHAPPEKPGLRHAKHASGRSALVAYAGCTGSGPRLYRALSLHLDPNGSLSECEYLEQVPRSTVESLLLAPLAEQGFEILPIAPGALRQHAIAATQLRLRTGKSLPRAYYLGRDLCGLYDEHLPRRSPRARRRTQDAALLARGTELLSRGRAELARDLLLQYTKGHPNDSEALATLGNCLVEVGDIDAAREYLSRASSLAPGVGRYHWNRAALAHREGRIGECFLALKDYLACSDESDATHRSVARELVASYGLRGGSLARNDERDDQNSSPSPISGGK